MRAKQEIILGQQDEIRGLSTPVLELEGRLLPLPIVGVVSHERARQVTDRLLATIWERHARAAVIDVTGLVGIDSRIVAHLTRTVEARVEGRGLHTCVDLRQGVEEAKARLQATRR